MSLLLVNSNSLSIPLADKSVHCIVTSPPYYGLRDYGIAGQLGLEESPEAYIAKMVDVFRECKRVLRDDGTLWLNIGDSYAGSGGPGGHADNAQTEAFKGAFRKYDNPNKKVAGIKNKDLIGIPWMLAFALRADGWYLRQDIIWHKPNPMPESVTDRCTKAHEYLFLLSKSARYYADMPAIQEAAAYDGRNDEIMKGSAKYAGSGQAIAERPHPRWNKDDSGMRVRNRRSVWTIPTSSYAGAHFATFPPALVEPCIKAGCPVEGVVFDPFAGSGTTLQVARALGCSAVGLDLSLKYLQECARPRLELDALEAWTQGIPAAGVLDDLPLFGGMQ